MARVFLVLFLVFLAGCATVPRSPLAPAETTLEGLCSKYTLDCAWDGVSQTVTMNYRGQKVQALVGSKTVMVGKARLILSAPLRRSQGAVVVPADFEKLVFGPISQPVGLGVPGEGRRIGRVVVDAGHGGKDPGAIGFSGLKEKDVNLDIARRIARNLKEAGWDVTETRDKDEFISLSERTAQASRPAVDLFVSVHANATKSRHARGFEVYYNGALTLEDQHEDQRRQNEKKICSQFNMKKNAGDLRDIVMDMLYMNKIGEAPRLAEAINKGLAKELGQNSRGSKTARFFVLRNTLVPAVLIEVGFISNPREAMQLKDLAYRQRIADAVTKSLMRYMYAAGM